MSAVSGTRSDTPIEGVRRVAAAPGGMAAVGPFSQAVVAGGLVFTSGQIPATGDATTTMPFGEQVRRTIDNLGDILHASGSSLAHVLKVNAFLTEPGQLTEYNRIYAEYFGADLPARTTVCVDLWGVALEIECVAVVASEEAGT